MIKQLEFYQSEKVIIQNKIADLINNNFSTVASKWLKEKTALQELGSIYENSLDRLEKKQKGQFYTPKDIVKYILSRLNITEHSTILDPACGCGSFLLSALEIFKDKYGADFVKNLYGVDIKEDAANLTKLSLAQMSGFCEELIGFIKNNIVVGNSLNSNEWKQRFKDIIHSGGFDYVIGNPPYVTLRKNIDFDPSEPGYKRIINGVVNAASLMIIQALSLLKENGILVFLLPKSLLYVNSYSLLRHELLRETTLLELFDLGSKFKGVRGEQIVLFFQKKKPLRDANVKIKIYTCDEQIKEKQSEILIKQKDFADFGNFLALPVKECYLLISKLRATGLPLANYVSNRIFRGLPIGGNRLNTGTTNCTIRGKNIKKFKIANVLSIPNDYLKNQSKSKINSLKQIKIVLQNIFSAESGIIAALDYDKRLTLDTVTNIIVGNERQGKFLLGLLNSKLINFFIMYGLFSCSKLTMHLDKSYIGQVPIIQNPNPKLLNNLLKVVDAIQSDIEIDKNNLRELDQTVYNLYDLNQNEIQLIERCVNNILSPKSRW